MINEEKKAIGWLSALDVKSEFEATNKEIILNLIEKQDKELEKWRKIKQDLIKVNKKIYDVEAIEELIEEICSKDKEIETFKKIAEYFAVKLYDLATEKMKEEYTTAQEYCEYEKLRDMCVRDMIISARNEVENGK